MKSYRQLVFVLPVFLFFLWSYALTDRALTLMQFVPYLRFQALMWNFADNHVAITVIYLLIVALLLAVYYLFVRWTKTSGFRFSWWLGIIILLLFTLSMNALSYDLYNYIFDAKLVLQYHLDPHLTAAITFIARDDWVRFMRNITFPTTYGYAWTLISLPPFVLGMGKLASVFFVFKLYALFAFVSLFAIQKRMLEKLGMALSEVKWRLAMFFGAPLVLIESLSSAHNDIWMMLPAHLSLLLLFPGKKAKGWQLARILVSGLLLLFSTLVKRATVMLLPIWIFFLVLQISAVRRLPKLLERVLAQLRPWWGDAAAGLMFLPLFTDLSRRFHPWYLLWSLSFLPFIKGRLLRVLLLTFMVTSLLRYVPVLYYGMYSDAIENMQRTITWSAVPIGIAIYLAMEMVMRRQRES